MMLHSLEQEMVGVCLPLLAPIDPSACMTSGTAAYLIAHVFRPFVVICHCTRINQATLIWGIHYHIAGFSLGANFPNKLLPRQIYSGLLIALKGYIV